MLPGAGQKVEGIMLATQELSQKLSKELAQELTHELTRPRSHSIRSACSNCGRPMHLVRAAPAAGDVRNARIYSCGECGVTKTETAIDRQAD